MREKGRKKARENERKRKGIAKKEKKGRKSSCDGDLAYVVHYYIVIKVVNLFLLLAVSFTRNLPTFYSRTVGNFPNK